jgi:fructose-bisphosphate aldolase class 1
VACLTFGHQALTSGLTNDDVENMRDAEENDRLMHSMRTRFYTSPAFGGDRVVGAILFADTAMNRTVVGRSTSEQVETRFVSVFVVKVMAWMSTIC